VFGPGQPLYRIVSRTIFFIKTGRRLQLHGGGYSERSFIDSRDVSEATWRIARDGRAGETYHISTDRRVTIRELVQMICRRLGVRFEDAVEVVGERLGKDAAYRLDSAKLRRELGWTNRITLEQGIEDTVAWVERWLADLKTLPQQYEHKP
jgi:dTDP-glucose 4,6-dehydratase